jgi:HlyD family secretion protein
MNDGLSSNLAALRIERSPVATRGTGRARTLVFGAALLAGVAGLAFAARPALSRMQRVEIEVGQVTSVSAAQAAVELTATGYVVPERVAKVASQMDGRILKVHLREGDQVHTGDLLFELDPVERRNAFAASRARVESARARVKVARANLAETSLSWERQKKLVASGAVAAATAEDLGARAQALQASVDAAEAEVSAASADASALSQALGDLRIAAPIDGVATTKPAAIGDVAKQGEPLVELVDSASLLIEAEVPEGRAFMIKPGVPCDVVFDAAPAEHRRGEVVALGPRVNRAKATATAKVKLLDPMPELRADMAARIGFLREAPDPVKLNAPPKIVIPPSAVVERGGQKVVFVVQGDSVHLEKNPAPGARVVLRPGDSLVEGSLVKEKGK